MQKAGHRTQADDLIEGQSWDWTRLEQQAQAYYDQSRYVMMAGGVGSGKTTWLCGMAILQSLMIPNNEGYLGRLDGKSLRQSTIQVLEDMIDEGMVQSWNDQRGRIKFKKSFGGSVIHFGDFKDPNDQKNMSLGWFAIDQAEEVDQSIWIHMSERIRRKLPVTTEDGSWQYSVLGACQARDGLEHLAISKRATSCYNCGDKLIPYDERRIRHGADRGKYAWKLIEWSKRGFGACNPRGPMHWIPSMFSGMVMEDGRVSEGMEGYSGYTVTVYDSLDAGFIDEAFVRDLELSHELMPHLRDRHMLGMWVEAEGRVYPAFNPTTHIIDKDEEYFDGGPLLDKSLSMCEYIDPGFTAPTAVGWVVIERECRCGCGKPNFWLVDEHYEAGKTPFYHAQQIKAHRSFLQFEGPIVTTLDASAFKRDQASGRGALKEDVLFSIADEYVEHDIYCVRGQKTWQVGHARISDLMAIDEGHMHPVTGQIGAPHFFVFKHCRQFIKEISNYIWKAVLPGRAEKDEPIGVNDHHMDGLNDFVSGRPELMIDESREDEEEARAMRMEDFLGRMEDRQSTHMSY